MDARCSLLSVDEERCDQRTKFPARTFAGTTAFHQNVDRYSQTVCGGLFHVRCRFGPRFSTSAEGLQRSLMRASRAFHERSNAMLLKSSCCISGNLDQADLLKEVLVS